MIDVPSLVEKVLSRAKEKDCGAVLIFVGIVRSDGGKVKSLVLEGDVPSVLEGAGRIASKHGVEFEGAHERGSKEPGEIISFLAVMGKHRKDCFRL